MHYDFEDKFETRIAATCRLSHLRRHFDAHVTICNKNQLLKISTTEFAHRILFNRSPSNSHHSEHSPHDHQDFIQQNQPVTCVTRKYRRTIKSVRNLQRYEMQLLSKDPWKIPWHCYQVRKKLLLFLKISTSWLNSSILDFIVNQYNTSVWEWHYLSTAVHGNWELLLRTQAQFKWAPAPIRHINAWRRRAKQRMRSTASNCFVVVGTAYFWASSFYLSAMTSNEPSDEAHPLNPRDLASILFSELDCGTLLVSTPSRWGRKVFSNETNPPPTWNHLNRFPPSSRALATNLTYLSRIVFHVPQVALSVFSSTSRASSSQPFCNMRNTASQLAPRSTNYSWFCHCS